MSPSSEPPEGEIEPPEKPHERRPSAEIVKQLTSGRPRRLSAFALMDVFAGGGLRPRKVPEQHWRNEDRGFEHGDVAIVDCQCGQQADVPLAAFPPEHECGRRFLYDGTAVWSLLRPPGVPTA